MTERRVGIRSHYPVNAKLCVTIFRKGEGAGFGRTKENRNRRPSGFEADPRQSHCGYRGVI